MFFQRVQSWLSNLLGLGSSQETENTNLSPAKKSAEQTKLNSPLKVSDRGSAERTIADRENAFVDVTTNAPSRRKAAETDISKETSRKKTDAPQPIDLIIGLDFGTAATKVVIRSPYLPGERARALSFVGLGHLSSEYLLPTRLRLRSDGHLLLSGNETGEWLTDLKTGLMDRDDEESVAKAGAFLALVIREAKLRFLTAERETYRRYEPRWSVNIGIPSAGYDDPAVRDRFLWAARLGWKLSEENKPLTLAAANEALAGLENPPAQSQTAISVVPEVVAQAIGYARSPLRDPGLHLLVDVGASTLDVCSFFLRAADGQDNYDLLTATVHRLGVMELHRHRLSALRCQDNVKRLEQFDPLTPLPEALLDYHPGCSCGAVDIDGEFKPQITRIILRHLAELKKRRDPYSERWRTGLPIFFCGGGSSVQLFRSAAAMADTEFRKIMIAAPVQLRPLPKPTTLVNRDIGDNLYHRLSVAYGLSFEAFNLGSVSAPSALEDIVPEKSKSDYESRYVSKDQV